MALACLEETIPRALVNEKCASALEFRMITPNPSSVFGGLTIGNMTVHNCAREIERPIEPLSAKAAISALCGSSDFSSVCPRRRVSLSTTRTQAPWMAASAEIVRTWRNRFLGLIGRFESDARGTDECGDNSPRRKR